MENGMARNRKRQFGFNLAELTATLAVIGIGASLAVPNMQRVMQDGEQTAVINELSASLRRARSEAVTQNLEVTVCPSRSGETCEDADWSDGWLVFTDPDGNRQVTDGDTMIRQSGPTESLDILTKEFEHFLAYRPDGHLMVNSPTENTGQFTICDARGGPSARVLTIHITGQPRLAEHRPEENPASCEDA